MELYTQPFTLPNVLWAEPMETTWQWLTTGPSVPGSKIPHLSIADQYFLGNLYLSLTNATGGVVYVDQVWLEEQMGPDLYGPNVLPKSRANAHTYHDPVRSWQWDQILNEATARNIYLKLVVLEKNEWIFNRITPVLAR